MEKKAGKPLDDAHDLPPQDEATKKKIDKHLSDESDTISEQDIKNINTSTGTGMPDENHRHDIDEADEIIEEKSSEDEDPEEEAPSAWEIMGE